MRRSDHIDNLELTNRTRNCLIRRGITTVGELVDMSSHDLLSIRGLGGKGLREILEKLKRVMPQLAPLGGYVEHHQMMAVARLNGASEALLDALDKIPEADAEPVRRSNWRRIKDREWICENCGNTIMTLDTWEHPLKDLGIKYCEVCGANMEKKKHGNDAVGNTAQGK